MKIYQYVFTACFHCPQVGETNQLMQVQSKHFSNKTAAIVATNDNEIMLNA